MEHNNDIKTNIALITGGSRGIGFAVAHKLIEMNCFVIVTCTNPDNISLVENKLFKSEKSNNGIVTVLDVRNEEQIQGLSHLIAERYGKLDYLINCAGIMEKSQSTVKDEKSSNWDEVIDINLKGSFLMCKYMIPLLELSSNPHIINISGGLGLFSNGMAGGTLPAYRISKTGINALSLILSEELKENKIMVNSVDPGWVRTDLGGKDAPKTPEEAANDIICVLEAPFDLKKSGALIKEGHIISY
ncbi:MAG: short-chain alcohol dehydrogenase [Herbinix sp.]|jgi:NAD(P)-dependent dehydrogenase (short-subunit alcohol dehydrogenase family)|nr:short-chain alcohol dehydrogenase [Herbinix sp.]